jgi:hypothetical protein
MGWTRWAIVGWALAAASAAYAQAAKPSIRIEITSRTAAYGGTVFGEVGPYEKLTGVARLQIDPGDPANRGVVDLDKAPRNAYGLVDYDVDLVILRPRDPRRARRVMIYDVVNRGMMTTLATYVGPGAGAMDRPIDPRAAFALERGYTLVFSGWQGDLADDSLIGARFPVATDKGRPITGRISVETVFDDPSADRITLPYPAAKTDQASASLSFRPLADSPPEALPASRWRFEDDRHVAFTRPPGADAGAIFTMTYLARDPKVMGLGFTAVRDLVAFLRHGSAEAGNPLADLSAAPCERDGCAARGELFESVVAYGASQSGRYLRDFVWQGFNRDLTGRRVFDGAMVMIAGGRRTFTNMRFAEPGRFSRQHEDHGVPGFDFPFTYATLRDPVTGRTDGILERCSADGSCPKIFHIDTSAEFWQAGASLVGTGGGDHDVALPDGVRAYMIAGGAHAPGMAWRACRSAPNPMVYNPVVRALTARMVDWTLKGRTPPDSRWPRVAAGELQPIEALKTPDLSAIGVTWPKVINRPITPAGGRGRWPVLAPIVDVDGNDVPGVRMPQIAVPDATYLGWDLRKAGYGEGDLCLVFAAWAPFAPDAAARQGDPRPSMAERYGDGERPRQLRKAAEALRDEGLLLDADIEGLAPASP